MKSVKHTVPIQRVLWNDGSELCLYLERTTRALSPCSHAEKEANLGARRPCLPQMLRRDAPKAKGQRSSAEVII